MTNAEICGGGCYMPIMTNQARLALLDEQRSKLIARLVEALREGRDDTELLAQVRALSRERVDIAAA